MKRALYEVQRAMRARRETALRRGVIAVLDIGTSKVSCLVLQFVPEEVGEGVETRPVLRQGAFRVIGAANTRSRGIAQGEIAGDQATFVKHANDVAALGAMIPEGFIPNSAVEGSAALPVVWTNMAYFQAKSMALASAAQALATAAQRNFESAKGMVQSVGGTCGDCHRRYRRRQE
jgi:cytochrome c556